MPCPAGAPRVRRPSWDEDSLAGAGPEVPHRERYLRLSFSLARTLVAAHREWIAEIDEELADR